MRKLYSKEEIARLKQNPGVFWCCEKMVNYTYEFKKRAFELYAKGIKEKEIWKRAGFATDKWKGNYFRDTVKDWRRIVRKKGVDGLKKQGGVHYDRGPTKVDSDTLKRLEIRVKYLEAENDFLAKLRAKRAE
jgi:transposase